MTRDDGDTLALEVEAPKSLRLETIGAAVFVFVVVEGILFYSLFRFRRRTHGPQAAPPPQVYGSKSIEIATTAAPALVVFVLVLVTARTLWEVNVPPPPKAGDNTLFVTVILMHSNRCPPIRYSLSFTGGSRSLP